MDDSFWMSLPASVARDIRPGDPVDPLAGVIRFRVNGERDVDIVVGPGAWDADIVARAEATTLHGRTVPTARVEDVILLKLYAGGSQDRWDIEQLVARPDRDAVVALVDRQVGVLPPDARRLWATLRPAGRQHGAGEE